MMQDAKGLVTFLDALVVALRRGEVNKANYGGINVAVQQGMEKDCKHSFPSFELIKRCYTTDAGCLLFLFTFFFLSSCGFDRCSAGQVGPADETRVGRRRQAGWYHVGCFL